MKVGNIKLDEKKIIERFMVFRRANNEGDIRISVEYSYVPVSTPSTPSVPVTQGSISIPELAEIDTSGC